MAYQPVRLGNPRLNGVVGQAGGQQVAIFDSGVMKEAGVP